jgi:hypothetical protein
MATIDSIKKRWKEHENTRFPLGVRGKTFAGLDPTLIQSNVSKYIITAINLEAPLSARMIDFMSVDVADLEKLIPALPEGAKSYYQEILDTAKDVMRL